LWRDEPVELVGEPWALPIIEEKRLRLVSLATRAGELLLARGEPEEARRLAQIALRIDPWSERIHRTIVAAHVATGNDAAAGRALEHYASVLGELDLSATDVALEVDRLCRLVVGDELADPRSERPLRWRVPTPRSDRR
jgi:hypothetical protein